MADRAEVSATPGDQLVSPNLAVAPSPASLEPGPYGVRPGPAVSPSGRSQGSAWEPGSQGSHPQALTWDAL